MVARLDSVSRSVRVVAALALFSCTIPVLAQPEVPSSTPDRLDFGQVRQGAKVEGSVNVFFEGKTTDGVPLQVYPPPFATVSGARIYHQEFGTGNDRVVAAVYLSLPTDQLGVAEADMTVVVGDKQATVPVRIEIIEPSETAAKILVVDSPFNRHAGHSPMFERWRELVKAANLDPDYCDSPQSIWFRPEMLEGFDVVILGREVFELSPRDIEELHQFVRDGGRLIVGANAFMVGSVPAANHLLEPTGLRIEDTENAGGIKQSLQAIVGDDLAEHPALKDVTQIVTFRASPIQIVDPTRAEALISAPDVPDRAYVAVAKLGEGEIVALGESLWASWINTLQGFRSEPPPTPLTSDNAHFLKNVLTLKDWPAIEAEEK